MQYHPQIDASTPPEVLSIHRKAWRNVGFQMDVMAIFVILAIIVEQVFKFEIKSTFDFKGFLSALAITTVVAPPIIFLVNRSGLKTGAKRNLKYQCGA